MITMEAQKKILNSIAENAKSVLKKPQFEMQSYKINSVADKFGELFEKQEFYTSSTNLNGLKWRGHETKVSNALAFEMSIFNSIMLKDVFSESIDNVFSNAQSPLFADMTAEEKEQSKQQLQELIDEKLDVVPRTNSAKLFKLMLESQYEREVINKEGDKSALRADFAEAFMKPVEDVLDRINKNHEPTHPEYMLPSQLDQQITEMRYNISKTGSDLDVSIMTGITTYLDDYASETDIIDHTVKNVNIDITRDSKISLTEFFEHCTKGYIAPNELQWAADIFDNAYNGSTPRFENFIIGNDRLFNDAEISNPENEQRMKAIVVAEALSGRRVEVLDPETHTKEFFSLQISDKRRENRSFIEKIVDFFKDLFNIGLEEKEKLRYIQNRVEKDNQYRSGAYVDFDTLTEHRENITFDELSAESAVDKVTTAVKKSRALENEPSIDR